MPPGAYFICAIPKIPDGPNESTGEVTTCYPSAAADAAGVLNVLSGEVQRMTLRILQVKTYSVRGRIDTSMVRKVKGLGMEIRVSSSGNFIPGFGSHTSLADGFYYGCVNRDGSFLISGLPSRFYTLQATVGRLVETLLCKPDKTGKSVVPVQASWTDVPQPLYYFR
jgi:hypothetical protein